MTPRKLDLLVATYSYGGNGGIASEVPHVRRWLSKMQTQWRDEERLGRVCDVDFCNTPITMTRNDSVCVARENNFDLLLMIDSDMWPDVELGCDPDAKPFWDEAFEFIYSRFEEGPHVVAAPYCGPPPIENIYSFRWDCKQSHHPDDMDHQLVQYTRYEAAEMSGIQGVAALPTGLILWDVRAFELTEPREEGDKPWFYYEYTDKYQRQKGSTEDVTATRDMSLAGVAKLGYNPIFCAWSSWAGHWKPKCVRKPRMMTPDLIGKTYKRALEEGRLEQNRKRMEVDFTKGILDQFGGPKGFEESLRKEVGEEKWAAATRGE